MNRTYFYIIGFGALMLFDTLTQVSFKLASSHVGAFSLQLEWFVQVFSGLWIYGAVLGYLGAFVAWMTLLKHAPVGPAFAASHLEIVFVLLLSVLFFGEQLRPMQIMGALCIVLGIVFLSLSESKKTQE